MTLISPLPDIWYNSIRNSEKRLDSSPVEFVFQLSPEALRSLVAEVRANAQASTTADAVKATIMRAVSVDVVFYDGSPVTVFCPSSTTHETLVAKPDITSAELDTERGHVTLRVTRKLPLSSNHGNRYFRLGFILCLGDLQHVVFTRAVQVLAKQGPSERKQRYWAVAKAEPERPAYVLQRFSSIQGRLYADFDGYSAPLPLSSIAASSRKRPRSGPTAAHTLGESPAPPALDTAASLACALVATHNVARGIVLPQAKRKCVAQGEVCAGPGSPLACDADTASDACSLPSPLSESPADVDAFLCWDACRVTPC